MTHDALFSRVAAHDAHTQQHATLVLCGRVTLLANCGHRMAQASAHQAPRPLAAAQADDEVAQWACPLPAHGVLRQDAQAGRALGGVTLGCLGGMTMRPDAFSSFSHARHLCA